MVEIKESFDEIVFEKPLEKVITIKGYNFLVKEAVSYEVGTMIGESWIGGMVSDAAEIDNAKSMKDLIDEILLDVVLKPKLTRKVLDDPNFPQEFSGFGMGYFMKVIQNLGLLDASKTLEELELEEQEVDEEITEQNQKEDE